MKNRWSYLKPDILHFLFPKFCTKNVNKKKMPLQIIKFTTDICNALQALYNRLLTQLYTLPILELTNLFLKYHLRNSKWQLVIEFNSNYFVLINHCDKKNLYIVIHVLQKPIETEL